MKKSLFLAAIATIALASCTQNELTIERQEIGFSPLQYKAVNSKAIIEGNKYPSDLSFGLYAYHYDGTSNKLYINNATCSYDETAKTFISDPIAYWPLSGTLGMVAWSPQTITATYDLANKKLSVPFVAAGREGDLVDLMYSTPLSGLDKTKQTVSYSPEDGSSVTGGGAGVDITFNHALSQIVVNAKVADTYTGAVYNITGLSLQSMDDNNTLNVTENATPVASWGTASVKTATFSIFSGTSANLDTGGANVGSAVLVIPQALDANQQKLVVNYQMTYNGVTTSTSRDVYLNSGASPLTALAMGKKYTLNLTISADKIQYSPSIAVDWDTTLLEKDYGVQ